MKALLSVRSLCSMLPALLVGCTLMTACAVGTPTAPGTESSTSLGSNKVTFPSSNPTEPPLPFLTVSKEGKLVDSLGNVTVLHGVNLGGWLIQESWMCPVDGSDCNADSIALLESRFGTERTAALFESYAENYIRKDDIRRIADLGCNCIRIPFWYRNFMDESYRFLSENPDEIFGFRMLDRLIEWCEDYRIYLILDLHGAPGGQSIDHCTGSIGQCNLFTDPTARDATVRLWTAIADRYADCPTVAAYDLLNEPMNNGSTEPTAGSPDAIRQTTELYDLLYKAIRAVDNRHPITLEGIWSTDCLPNPADYGWENLIYQLHLYDSTREMIDYRVSELNKVRTDYGVAVYVGEFNNGDEFMEYGYSLYQKNGISRTMWNYKVARGNLGNWGLYAASVDVPNLQSDSSEEILRKWGECLQTRHFTLNPTVRRLLKKYAD